MSDISIFPKILGLLRYRIVEVPRQFLSVLGEPLTTQTTRYHSRSFGNHFFELSLDFLCSLHIKAKVALPTETHDVRSSKIVETMNCAITTHIKDALKEPQKLS